MIMVTHPLVEKAKQLSRKMELRFNHTVLMMSINLHMHMLRAVARRLE